LKILLHKIKKHAISTKEQKSKGLIGFLLFI
jgi:hypothetical protein